MGILGIPNRTENWMTAQTFAPYFECHSARTHLAKRLLEPLGEDRTVQEGTVKIELFWHGIRDYIDLLGKKRKPKPTPEAMAEDFSERYKRLFPNLHQEIEEFGHKTRQQSKLKCDNYTLETKDQKNSFYNNLRYTEIDIVLKTPGHLLIGEAKYETTEFNRDGNILMHQLIRQYVMATILIDCLESNNRVIPFVVGDDPNKLKKNYPQQQHIHQIDFMTNQHKQTRLPGNWLNEENILSWDCIKKIAESASADS